MLLLEHHHQHFLKEDVFAPEIQLKRLVELFEKLRTARRRFTKVGGGWVEDMYLDRLSLDVLIRQIPELIHSLRQSSRNTTIETR